MALKAQCDRCGRLSPVEHLIQNNWVIVSIYKMDNPLHAARGATITEQIKVAELCSNCAVLVDQVLRCPG